MNCHRLRAVFGVCLAVAVALVVPAAASAATPATLTGELFHFGVTGGAACGQSGTVPYTVSGTATGPYSGTFTETGTVTGTGNTGTGIPDEVTSLKASFTIYSSSGAVLVRGTKTASSGNFCHSATGTEPGTFVAAQPSYQAAIFTPTGAFSDNGSSDLNFFADATGTVTRFDEDFTSALTQPVLISCKDGGWQNFPQFKNQGDCVSFVATGGKNPPSGS